MSLTVAPGASYEATVEAAVIGVPAGSATGGQEYVMRSSSADSSAPTRETTRATNASSWASLMRVLEWSGTGTGATSCVSSSPPRPRYARLRDGGASSAPGIRLSTPKTRTSRGGLGESARGSRSNS
jgi:hypothetical protein